MLDVVGDLLGGDHRLLERLLALAELEAGKILHNAQARLAAIIDDIHEMKRQKVLLAQSLRGVLATHTKLLALHEEDDAETAGFEDNLKVLGGRKAAARAPLGLDDLEADIPAAEAGGPRR